MQATRWCAVVVTLSSAFQQIPHNCQTLWTALEHPTAPNATAAFHVIFCIRGLAQGRAFQRLQRKVTVGGEGRGSVSVSGWQQAAAALSFLNTAEVWRNIGCFGVLIDSFSHYQWQFLNQVYMSVLVTWKSRQSDFSFLGLVVFCSKCSRRVFSLALGHSGA